MSRSLIKAPRRCQRQRCRRRSQRVVAELVAANNRHVSVFIVAANLRLSAHSQAARYTSAAARRATFVARGSCRSMMDETHRLKKRTRLGGRLLSFFYAINPTIRIPECFDSSHFVSSLPETMLNHFSATNLAAIFFVAENKSARCRLAFFLASCGGSPFFTRRVGVSLLILDADQIDRLPIVLKTRTASFRAAPSKRRAPRKWALASK